MRITMLQARSNEADPTEALDYDLNHLWRVLAWSLVLLGLSAVATLGLIASLGYIILHP